MRKCILISISATLILLAACVTPQESRLLGKCLEIQSPQKLWSGKEESFMGADLLTEAGRESIFWDKKVVDTLPAGTRVRITKILKDWSGSYGSFLRVEVEIMDGKYEGRTAGVPSIAPYHPQPTWVLEHTLNPNELRFDPEIVRECRN